MNTFANMLVRSRLLSAEEVKRLHKTWRVTASSPTDVKAFADWLVREKYLTRYQTDMLQQGRSNGFVLNEYKILERIGVGRMAGVYRAVHRLGHIVAIKVLPPSRVKDAAAFGRFQREARVATRLKHPNIVRTFHAGQVGDDIHYLVMELVEGETLEEVLDRRKRLPPAEAGRLIVQALHGLQHLYEQKIVHRDLKPGNLMLTPAVEPGQTDTTAQATLKIVDVGLAKETFEDFGLEGFQGRLTTGQEILGLPRYMAPEQARDAHAADVRADIYTLGCVLFHTLAGRPPFVDDNPAGVMVKHLTEPPPRLEKFLPNAPPGLQDVLDRMLAKDPAQRYPMPDIASEALEDILSGGRRLSKETPVDVATAPYLNWVEKLQAEAEQPGAPAPPVSGAPDPAQIETVVLEPEQTVAPPEPKGAAKGKPRIPLMWIGVGVGSLLLAAVLGAIGVLLVQSLFQSK
jgi:serine/threonine protein kinase